MEIKGIDVSSYQSKPDWAKVSNSEIKFAMLRIHQKSGTDSSFEYNYKGCKSNGILVGGYKYSYALTPAQAIDEAESVISVLSGRGMDFPIFYDLEWSQQRNLGKQAIENIAVAFLTRIKKVGYKVGIYCNICIDNSSTFFSRIFHTLTTNKTGATCDDDDFIFQYHIQNKFLKHYLRLQYY